MIQRHAAAGLLAFGVTFGLFYLMQALITKAAGKLDESTGSLVEFVRLKKDTDPELKKRELPRKEKPEQPPPPSPSGPARVRLPARGRSALRLRASFERWSAEESPRHCARGPFDPLLRRRPVADPFACRCLHGVAPEASGPGLSGAVSEDAGVR